MMETCPHCRHRFEREEGYWVSAMIVDTIVTESIFGIFFVGVLIATIPEVAWVPVLVVGVITNVVVPVLFYPLAKTTWVAIDVHFNPPPAPEPPLPASGR